MTPPFILRGLSDGVLTLTLNRPEVLNAFHLAMARELQGALAEAAAESAVRAVLLTGAGRAFCAGQDLGAVPFDPEHPPEVGATIREQYNPIVRAIRALEKPVVCAVNGVAAGAGANLALACDIVVASREASFIQSFIRIGLIPDSGGTWLLPRLVGMARASALMMSGDKLPAQTALEWGLVYATYEPAELMDRARALAEHLATQPTRGLGLTKRALNRALGNTLDQQLDVEEEIQREAGHTHDFVEGVKAFLEKRKPDFTGQ